MGNIWVVTTFILMFMFIILIIYHMYYRKNIKHITKQLIDIISTPDTNEILTVRAKQKNIVNLVNILNELIKKTSVSNIKFKRMNMKFRQGIINIAHDLRTPLSTASGYVQMLQTNVTESEKQEYLRIILERQNMVKMLLEQFFEYVRMESGEIVYEHVAIDAKKIFIDTLASYYDDFTRKGEEPVVNLIEKPCVVLGDEQGIKRIFSNLLFNAITHGKGGYYFKIQEDENYVFTFSNISHYMSEDDLENIFDRFYVKDKSRNKNTTGLGLAIVKEITTRLNGSVKAFYDDGKLSISILFPKVK